MLLGGLLGAGVTDALADALDGELAETLGLGGEGGGGGGGSGDDGVSSLGPEGEDPPLLKRSKNFDLSNCSFRFDLGCNRLVARFRRGFARGVSALS